MTSHLTHAEPTPPFPKQEQESPGREAEMRPLADHGEDSYVGQGRLKDILIDGSRSPATPTRCPASGDLARFEMPRSSSARRARRWTLMSSRAWMYS